MQKQIWLVMLCAFVVTAEAATQNAEQKLVTAVAASPVKLGQTWVFTQKLPKSKVYKSEIKVKNIQPKFNKYGALEFSKDNKSIYYSAKDKSVSVIDVTMAEKNLDKPLYICVGQIKGRVVKGIAFGVPYMQMSSKIGDMNEKRLHNPKLFKSYLKSKKLDYGTCTISLKK